MESEVCTGCGKCEKACITEKAAIIVLPREIALGKVGANYIKGWEAEDEMRLQEVQGGIPKKPDSKVRDYLNSGDL